MKQLVKHIFILLPATIMLGCKTNGTPRALPPADTSITTTNAYTEVFFDSSRIGNFIAAHKLNDSVAVQIETFYRERNYQYAWFFSDGKAPHTDAFIAILNEYIATMGDSTLYYPKLEQLADSTFTQKINPADTGLVNDELSLTYVFFEYSKRAYQGNVSLDNKDLKWFIPRKKIDPKPFLDSLIANEGRNIEQYEPVNSYYQTLKKALTKYYKIQEAGSWTPIVGEMRVYREGDKFPAVTAIKKRLHLTDDLKSNDTSSLFTPELTVAVKSFQSRYGLKEDGGVSPDLVKEMNRPIEERIRQMLVNLERMRWLPPQPKGHFLLVNIPQYKLSIFEDGKFSWNMNVIVGTAVHNTVVFTGNMKYVVFSPYWNVPPSIQKNEILPAMKRNKNYLARHNMEWNNGAIRQKPGPNNSLGPAKFLFPNSYNIYLHGTPAQGLFAQDKRAFSHGCIRIEDPGKLARYVLRDNPDWDSVKIAAAMKAGVEKYVTIKEPLPVFIGYFTAWVDHNGKLNFREDVYGHDKRLAEYLFKDQ